MAAQMLTAAEMSEARVTRAMREMDGYTVTPLDGSLIVEGPNGSYITDPQASTCSCLDWQYRCSKANIPCKHITFANLNLLEAGQLPEPAPTFRVVGACRRTGKLKVVREGITEADAEALRRKLAADPLTVGFSLFLQRDDEPLPW